MCRVLGALRAITGSHARAAVLEELVTAARPRSATDVAGDRRTQLTAIRRELESLTRAGLVRRAEYTRSDHSRLFEMDPAFPGYPDLRRAVLVMTGPPAAIRRSVAPIDPRQLAWIHGPYAEGPVPLWRIRLLVITSRPRQIRRAFEKVQHELGARPMADVMSIAEWVTRLQQRDLRVRAIRRSVRMWLLGSDEALRNAERHEIERRDLWKAAMENWRDEYEWDADDPVDERTSETP